MKTYIVKYEIHFNDGSKIKDKEMKVKNCEIAIGAQVKLEKYLKKKYDNFESLVVHSCKEDIMSAFNSIFDGDTFGGGSPFGGNSSFGDIFGTN